MTVRSLSDVLLAAVLLACLSAGAACSGNDDDDSAPNEPAGGEDAASGKDGGRPPRDGGKARDAAAADAARDGAAGDDAGGATLNCRPIISPVTSPIADPETSFPVSTFAWAGEGMVGLWPRENGTGYRMIELDRMGAPLGEPISIWKQEVAVNEIGVAVSGDVVAVVDQLLVGINSRTTCRFGLVAMGGAGSLAAPKRFSDVPDDETGAYEAVGCRVAPTADGFLLVWHQRGEVALEWSLFAQHIGRDGALRGARLTIDSVDDGRAPGAWVRSDGERVLIAHETGSQEGAQLSLVDGDDVDTAEIALDSSIRTFGFARGEYLLRTSNGALHVIDASALMMRGPYQVGPGALIAPVGERNFMAVRQEDVLEATAYDHELAERSTAVPLTQNRGTVASALMYAPDGSSTVLIVIDGSRLLAMPLSCV